MRDINFRPLKEHKSLILAQHLLVIAWMVGFQFLLLVSIGFELTIRGGLLYLLQIITYLVLYYWVIPLFFNRKTKGVGWLRIFLVISIYCITRGSLSYHGKKAMEFLYFVLSFNQLIFSTAHLTIIIGLNFLFGLYRYNEQLRQDYIEALQEKLTAETEKVKIESIVTQMRLSPHLMLNTLNYIQEKADGVLPEVVQAVDLFSGIVQHSMFDVLQSKTVLLYKEIEKVKQQIKLHSLLSNGNVSIDFDEAYDESIENAMIPPSTLLTFVENVFRYGIVKDPAYIPSIKIKLQARQFTFLTWNYKRSNPHSGSGMGIKSVASTLGYYYPGKHNLRVENREDTFRLTLTIQL